ncbi:biofilm regulation protein phosphatase SiaA [Noviherbaspirillum sp. CPCC 100848]|uniref:Biofilm regulation protein phosphatase SiaA n=1 Tax=Noviherbaspirillum album TaxID=3080276 RepID=A0ABU6J5Z0_9BURK|nr:biofilm regulation protein phosphatase SiaA [Noviherbaspirillum sp. CPCC 100848]MEC4718848.1 biofilm regulation protein phosphatase SiaA [Noviherbaspirillum sp. CPCC 100848]
MTGALGLRGKSVLALFGTCMLVLLLAGVAGWQAVESIRSHLGVAFTRNFTLLNRERILAPVARELALSLRLARSQSIQQWLKDENNPEKKALALQEAESFRNDFDDKSFFLASALSYHYYFSDAEKPTNGEPRYTIKPDDPHDIWFFNSLKSTEAFNINVDPDPKLGLTKVWFNVLVRDGERKLGLCGTGLDLSKFLSDFISTSERGVTPMIVDVNGAIQAHPDNRHIAFNSGAGVDASGKSLFGLLEHKGDADRARTALVNAARHPGSTEPFFATLHGKKQLLAASYIPELKWHVLTAVDLEAAEVIDSSLLRWIALAVFLLLGMVMGGFVYAMNRLVLAPLLKLKQSARELAAGNYALALPPARNDEIGELTAAFAAMASKVRRHTEELEETVRERTRELVLANRDMSVAHKKISDSISYASLIQRAILPDRELAAALGSDHFVLWRPRDVVGGDFYVYREVEGGCLIGVVDCAGHGVPGAFMTMLARAAIDKAIDEAGAQDPAAILARTDQVVRSMLKAQGGERDIATIMDAGLVHVDVANRRATFAGAKISLYWSECGEGGEVEDIGSAKGGRRSLGDRHQGEYANQSVDLLPARTFYLATDGFLDQAGGDKGYGFGNARFIDMLRRYAGRPLAEQSEAFAATLAEYQGGHAQRDDITLVCFRFI